MSLVFLLLIAYQLKHFVADYPLQGRYMLGKFRPGWDFLGPLAAHAAVHGALTFCIAGFFSGSPRTAACLALFDSAVHFAMDRIKAGPKYLGRFKDMAFAPFWWCLGFDQMVHHLTHYAIIYWLVTHASP
jgi:hypothetical protein